MSTLITDSLVMITLITDQPCHDPSYYISVLSWSLLLQISLVMITLISRYLLLAYVPSSYYLYYNRSDLTTYPCCDQVIKMLDDHGVSSDGVAVYEIAYQVKKSAKEWIFT